MAVAGGGKRESTVVLRDGDNLVVCTGDAQREGVQDAREQFQRDVKAAGEDRYGLTRCRLRRSRWRRGRLLTHQVPDIQLIAVLLRTGEPGFQSRGAGEGNFQPGHQPTGFFVSWRGHLHASDQVHPEWSIVFQIKVTHFRFRLQCLAQQTEKRRRKIRAVFFQNRLPNETVRIFSIPGVICHVKASRDIISAPDMLRQFGLTAIGSAVPGGDQLVFVSQDQPFRAVDGKGSVFVFGIQALKNLVVGGVHNIIVRIGIHFAQRISPGADGLGFQGFQRKGIAHFIGHDALQIGFQRQGQHCLDRAVFYRQGQVSRVEALLEIETDAGYGIAFLLPQEGQFFPGGQGDGAGKKDELSAAQEDSDVRVGREQKLCSVRAAGQVAAFQCHPDGVRQVETPQRYPDFCPVRGFSGQGGGQDQGEAQE